MNKPSSTITAATIAGLAMSAFWGTLNEFTDLTISAGYIGLTVSLASGLAGYWKKEKVLTK